MHLNFIVRKKKWKKMGGNQFSPQATYWYSFHSYYYPWDSLCPPCNRYWISWTPPHLFINSKIKYAVDYLNSFLFSRVLWEGPLMGYYHSLIGPENEGYFCSHASIPLLLQFSTQSGPRILFFPWLLIESIKVDGEQEKKE